MVKIDNPELVNRFEKKSQNLIKLVGWTNMKHLHSDNSDLSILGSRGFVVSKGTSGLDFTVGNINSVTSAHKIADNNNVIDIEITEPEHTFIYSDVAIGRALVLDKDWNTTKLPNEFDSFYMTKNLLDINGDGEFDLFEYQQAASFDERDPTEYEHKYFIKDMTQISPKYIIKFKFEHDDDKKKKLELEKAENEKLSPNHMNLTNTMKGVNALDDPIFYDPETQKAVTMRQKMKQGGAKVIVPIEVAYEEALTDWKRDDPLTEGKKQWIEDQLDVIDEKVRDINLNYADVLEKINEAAAAATSHLQELTKSKLDNLLSVEIEFRRQKEQMLWMESLVATNFKSVCKKIDNAHNIMHSFPSDMEGKDVNDSAAAVANNNNNKRLDKDEFHNAQMAITNGQLEFLQIWKHHTQFRNAASRLKPRSHMEVLNNIKPSIAVKTDLLVYTDQTLNSGRNVNSSSTSKHHKGDSNHISRQPVYADEKDKKNLKDTLESIQISNNYSQPAKPSKDLISHLLQSVIDVEAGRIHDVLNEFIMDDKVPIPKSLHRPSASGKVYTSSSLIDVLTPSSVPLRSNIESVNHKELYFASMKSSLGHAPLGAKDVKHHVKHHGKHHDKHGKHDKSSKNGKYSNVPSNTNSIAGKIKSSGDAEAKLDSELERAAQEKLQFQTNLHEQRIAKLRQAQEESEAKLLAEQLSKIQQQQFLMPPPIAVSATASAVGGQSNHNNSLTRGSLANSIKDDDSLPPPPPVVPFNGTLTGGTGTGLTGTITGMHSLKPTPAGSIRNNTDDQSIDSRKKVIRGDGVTFSLDTLLKLSTKFRGFSLQSACDRRMQQMKTDIVRKNANEAIEELALSELLTYEKAQTLYYSLPFYSKPPTCRIIYSSAAATGDGRNVNLSDMYTKCMMSDNPSLLIIKSNNYIFGAYLSHPIRVTGSGWTGAPSCFIYSSTLDLKFPYHARNPPGNSTIQSKPVAFLAERDSITIGNGDLIIHDGGECETRMESCYGIGLTYGSSEAKCILAGTSFFEIDEMELWMVGIN